MADIEQQSVPIAGERDIVTVRKAVRDMATSMGFGITDVTRIVTAASELARNIVTYAGSGSLRLSNVSGGGRHGVEMVFEDEGPGIADLPRAFEVGYTTSGGLGLGLPGARRLVDEMEIQSESGHGTRVILKKWMRGR